MKVIDLIDILSELDESAEIYVANDAEGNGYRKLGYVADDAYVLSEELNDYQVDHIPSEEDINSEDYDFDDYVQVVVLGG